MNRSNESSSKFAAIRRIAPPAILVMLIAAAAYDFGIARPRVEAAFDRLASRLDEVNANANRVVTPAEVREVVGREPSEQFDDEPNVVEVYRWASGLPLRTHNLYVSYRPFNGELAFYRQDKFGYDDESAVSNEVLGIDHGGAEANQISEEEQNMFVFDPESDSYQRVERLIAERDRNDDGLLSGGELNEDLRVALDEVDMDSDGKLRVEEILVFERSRRQEVTAADDGAADDGDTEDSDTEDGG